ncbi:hypothetical protein NM208_g7528 [Fusarium decemcellulare]|uniref:Uncharacterized protein n=1 Tax=Fusarium decemcellulare TaxID=57161 RepID=A0ACC1S8Y9_9HYPO|nr:hypothetical protein NM208_g7528 [Fusarium decemcellulare]
MASGNIPGESNASQVRIPCIVFFVLTPIFIAIRIWSRIATGSGLGWDDWTIIASFVCALTVQVLMMVSCDYGFGQHISNLEPENKLMALELFYVAQIFYKLTINLTKISILLLYLRIFVQQWFRFCCFTLMAFITCYMIATTASSIWQCSPIRGAWDKSVQPTCINLTRNWYANAGFSIATDVLILMLPMQPIWASKLSMAHKRALMLVFTMGGFVTVTSIMRATTLGFSTTSPDTTYDITSTLWTVIEENVAIICACLPMCRMPLAILFPSLFAGSKTSRSDDYDFINRSPDPSARWNPYAGPRKAETFAQSVMPPP